MTKLSERMLRDLHVGIGDIVLSDIINEASALEARIEALGKMGQDILAAEMGDVLVSLKVAERLLAFKAALRERAEDG